MGMREVLGEEGGGHRAHVYEVSERGPTWAEAGHTQATSRDQQS